MNLYAAHFHMSITILEDAFLLFLEHEDKPVIRPFISVAQFTVFHMPEYFFLLSIHHFVGDTWIIRVDFKTFPEKSLGELFVA